MQENGTMPTNFSDTGKCPAAIDTERCFQMEQRSDTTNSHRQIEISFILRIKTAEHS